ncbi:hypothetical protein TCAL_05188 [Tigriopus californicus]|uniref:Alanine--glyoxylate aminotransferase 2-like n=1 Tax=Tigriopus californicus TaxID=6832 RepID=A0A553NZ68_TIGCA|nr:ethanolamine-phosphate phospho-lyase-like [Tigriopus californicus]TRY70717.1 hypothetical protein TCAL_05188 [Tigriopus californicus]
MDKPDNLHPRATSANHEQIPRSETISLREKHVGKSCKLFFKADPLKIVRAQGQYMYNEMGEELLDCINNVCHVGHCHPHVVKSGQDQMAILNTNNRFLHDNLVLYAERLIKTFPERLSVAFFVNSGSEANDLALRMARAHTKSREVITLEHAYHGHVISLMEISPYKFKNQSQDDACPDQTHIAPVPDVYRGKYRDQDYPGQDLGEVYAEDVKEICEKLAEQGKKPGCFIAESLQSCGGQIIYPNSYLRHVYNHVRAAGGLCIADEVQVGFGRVGTNWWAFQTYGNDVIPDIVTIGKPMGNGHPVAAVVTTEEVAASFAGTGIEYFNTYGGNPVSCSIASAVMDVIEDEKLMEHAEEVGRYLKRGLERLMLKHEIVGDVRGVGMFLGLDLVKDRTTREPFTAAAQHVLTRFREERILLQSDGPYNNVLKFKSPLVFNKSNADRLVNTLDEVLEEIRLMSNFID